MPGQWGNVEELLAATVEVLADFRRVFILAQPRPKGRGKPNVPEVRVPRPAKSGGQDREKPKPATSAELAAFMGARGVVIDYTPKPNDTELEGA